jgi:hypothetical protein
VQLTTGAGLPQRFSRPYAARCTTLPATFAARTETIAGWEDRVWNIVHRYDPTGSVVLGSRILPLDSTVTYTTT